MLNRLLIYFFYDKDGIIDDYVKYMLEKISPYTTESVFVSNGELQNDSKAKVEKYVSSMICRENKGFDVWAYKEALEYYGWDNLKKFDEIIFMNFTIMGPVTSFEEMFATMDSKNVDFWGITLFHGVPYDSFGFIKYGYIPLHIQSHFIAVRKSLFLDDKFIKYWNKMPPINSYIESICYHEAIFTKHFEDLGYKWDAYVDTRDMLDYVHYPLMFTPIKLMVEKRCPIFKRKLFFLDRQEFYYIDNGECASELLHYLATQTNYDINLIWDNILRTSNMYDIKNALSLDYILPYDMIKSSNSSRPKIALMMHIYFEDLIDYCIKYAGNMPIDADIYITTDTQEKANIIKNKTSVLGNNTTVLVVENRGRDVSALLVGLREYVYKYDLVCFAHDKKVSQLNYKATGKAFSDQCFENVLFTQQYVENIVTTFMENPRLGLLVPPPPMFAEYYPTFVGQYGWQNKNYDIVCDLLKKMNISVDIDINKNPVAPYGTIFWFRTDSIKSLFDLNLKYSDFPAEPIVVNGTVLHAIERMYSIIAQSKGYYTGCVYNEKFAKTYITNLRYMLSSLSEEIMTYTDPNYYTTVKERLHQLVVNRGHKYNFQIRKYGKVLKLFKKIRYKAVR